MYSLVLISFWISYNCLNTIFVNSADDWSHRDQGNWPKKYPNCGGQKQSPINIDSENVKFNRNLNINFINYNKPLNGLIADNTGHTVEVKMTPNNLRPQISGSAANGVYILEQFHFHWSQNDNSGTEHMIDNEKVSAELHFVHYNQKYPSIGEAIDKSDGLLVLTSFLRLSVDDNKYLKPIIDVLPQIQNYNTSAVLKTGLILENLLSIQRELYYRYSGSLTTPPCNEVVNWILIDYPITISSYQLSRLRQLFEKPINGSPTRIVNDVRVVQNLNNRIVEIWFQNRVY